MNHERNNKDSLNLDDIIEASNTTIYLVDDDEDYAELLQDMAEAAELNTICFTSSVQFLQAPLSNNDLVVLDLNMPEKDGIEVMRDLADSHIRPTFILISGFDERVLHSAKQLAESRSLHVAEILCKPINTEHFITVLSRVYSECMQACTSKEKPEVLAIKSDGNAITIGELKQAFKNGELLAYLQPQIRFDTEQLVGAEVLVRWQHPGRGLVYPDQFIPLAEREQLMSELTEAVIFKAIEAYQKLQMAGIHLTLSINISAQNIKQLDFPEILAAHLNRHKIPHKAFMLELTESEILTDTSAALDILNRLRMKGFSLSIDDFGTGDSSLKRLYQSPFSELKIDQHFVMRIEKDADATAIVRICSLLAKEFKMQTVAEGVETQAIWDKLKAIGCDIAQGYFIAKPMPCDAFIEFCKKHNREY